VKLLHLLGSGNVAMSSTLVASVSGDVMRMLAVSVVVKELNMFMGYV
jgi:hypothetical protein